MNKFNNPKFNYVIFELNDFGIIKAVEGFAISEIRIPSVVAFNFFSCEVQIQACKIRAEAGWMVVEIFEIPDALDYDSELELRQATVAVCFKKRTFFFNKCDSLEDMPF